jgi:biotin carboxyl carrier protein
MEDTMIFFFRRFLSPAGGINVLVVLLLAAQVLFVSMAAAEEGATDSEKIARMERLIKEQQQRMELLIKEQQQRMELLVKEQQQSLEALQQQVNQLKNTATESLAEAQEAKSVAEEAKATAQVSAAPMEKVVTSGEERVKITLAGMVNRAIFVVDDGDNTDAYFVDNDNAESRINLVGTAKATDDLTIGSRIELTIAPNKSGNVNQTTEDQDIDNIFDQRWVEVSLDSKRFGKFSLGKGNTASMNTAAADLSGTMVIAYATISDSAGGMLFREKDSDNLTNVRIVDAFNNWDGLNRRNRLRYDTPTVHGFRLATSIISDQRYDGALYWGGQGYGFKAIGSAAFADPNQDNTDLQFDGSFSILHEDTGLNLTLSAGKQERDNQSDPYNLYAKVGWMKRFFSSGVTAFAVDYTRSMNFPTVDDVGYSVGAAVVQPFDKFGTEIYGSYRLHSLDRDVEPDVHDINLFAIGTRVKF